MAGRAREEGSAHEADAFVTIPLPDRAAENLDFIRSAMERSAGFTAVSGLGGILLGSMGLALALISEAQSGAPARTFVWIAGAPIAFGVNLALIARKARRSGRGVAASAFRRFAWALAPSLFVGAVATAAAMRIGAYEILPGLWLGLYGAGVLAVGTFSLPIVRWMGGTFVGLGTVAFATTPALGNLWMALGFGGVNLGCGIVIARRYGG